MKLLTKSILVDGSCPLPYMYVGCFSLEIKCSYVQCLEVSCIVFFVCQVVDCKKSRGMVSR